MMAKEHGTGIPVMEAPQEIIEYLNRGRMLEFEKGGSMMYRDVIVCAQGKKESVKTKYDVLHSKSPYEIGQDIARR